MFAVPSWVSSELFARTSLWFCFLGQTNILSIVRLITLFSGPSHINYVLRPDSERLNLMQGDVDTFADIISLIGEYEGTLSNQPRPTL